MRRIDKIKQMTADELSTAGGRVLDNFKNCVNCFFYDNCPQSDCALTVYYWLIEEVEGAENEMRI